MSGLSKMHSGIYKCPDNIKNFKLRVKLKKIHSSMANSNEDIDLNLSEKEMKTISWQEKVFSRSETEYYSNKKNCFTDLEEQYHEMVLNHSETEHFERLFTYVENDNFNPNDECVTTEVKSHMSYLQKEMSNLRLRKKIKDNSNNINSGYDINKFLNNSISNPFTTNSYETMYVMADLGSSTPNSDIWLKYEYILCKLKYDEINKLLWIYPDFSASENDYYNLEIDVGGKQYYEYTIENTSEMKNPEITKEENIILKKINRRKQEMKTQLLGEEFSEPNTNIIRYYIFCEILTAKNFEYDNIYIQYTIDLPDNWSSVDENLLFGSTQTCRAKGQENDANFGFYFDVCLDHKVDEDFDGVPECPVIYFQVISRDMWSRIRTEGLAYLTIPVLTPGIHKMNVQCMRICSSNVLGQLRRFFIGDYFNIDDFSWLRFPREHEDSILNKYGIPTIGTGTISVRMNILNQSKASKRTNLNDSFENDAMNRSHATTLVKSVAEVIIAFRRARERMLQARKNVLKHDEEI